MNAEEMEEKGRNRTVERYILEVESRGLVEGSDIQILVRACC